MKKLFLLVAFILASITSFAQGEGELVSDNVSILKDYGYRMFIKSYSDLAIEKTNERLKFAVKYFSDDPTIVKPDGNAFRGASVGSTKVTMQVSTVKPGSNDSFDPDNIVMEKSFNVTVSEEDNVKLPTIDISWGTPRDEFITNQVDKHNLVHFTDAYYSHFPNVVENNPEYIKQLEVFYTDNFEAPIIISQFTEDDLLVANSVIFASWERVNSTDSYVYKWLQDVGFEAVSSEPPYWNLLLNSQGILTHASWESVIIDNVWFIALQLNYDGVDTAIDNIEDEFAIFDVTTTDNTINVTASEYAGLNITLSDVSGKCIANTTVNENGNVFTVPSHGMYIIKIDGCKAVKVIL